MERIHKFKTDYGMTDYYKYYIKNCESPVSKAKYHSVISDFNEELRNLIIEDNLQYTLPSIGFEISIRKDKRKPRIQNGKLINNVPPDWHATNELWERHPEAKEKKLLVRHNNSHTSWYVFRIYCKKLKSKMRNKGLYRFKPNRKFQRQLSARIKDPNKDNFDAFLLYDKNN